MAPSFQDRLLALSPRERLFLGVGTLAVLLFLIFMLLPDADDPLADGSVEIAQAPPVAPPPAPVVPYTPPPVAAPVVSVDAANGLVLQGVTPSGAIITMQGGNQRLVPVGREVVPGLTLREVAIRHAILSGAGGDLRLELGRPGAFAVVAVAPAPTPASGGGGDPLAYRMGLAPRKAGGRTTGFTIRPDANLPLLAKAGLRPGDVIVAVNGQAFESEEKVLELEREIAGSYTAEFEYERGGQRMKAALKVNER